VPVVLLVVVKQLISAFSCLLTLLLAVLLVPPLVELVLLVPFVELLVLEPPLVLVSELPFFFLDVLLPLIAKAGEARVLAVISTIAVTMAIVAKVVVFIHILLTTLSSYI
jgi:hypothetical protein